MRVVIVTVGERERAQADRSAVAADRFRRLPPPVRVEDTISTKEASTVPDPTGGRDVERDFMLRYAGGL